jgi:DNA topoisomerase-1
MPKSLVIVESNAKSKTINRFLGKSYIVRASIGHIKNLPKNRLGVDIEKGFEPEYVTIRGRGKVLQELKRLASSSDMVYLATDPDREGEAIAYHLANEIRSANGKIKRVLFHEITEHAIQDAIQHSLEIDEDKVEAQKARRVMDRLVGYQVSPILWKTIYRGLSAGRVQSVALRLICEREAEIRVFIPEEYWSIEAHLRTNRSEFCSKLIKIDNEEVRIVREQEAKEHVAVLEKLEYRIDDIRKKLIFRKPYPPYTTSTLQQDATRKLNLTTKQIMAVAQQLYEGIDLPEGRVGLITYMRTDSTRVASTAVEEVRRYIAENYGLEYVPQSPAIYRNKKSAQDAHEAIRPTSMNRPPRSMLKNLTPVQKKLYDLIWNRFVASQMAPAKIEQTTVDIMAGNYLFRSSGSVIKFKGFIQLYGDEIDESQGVLPATLRKGLVVDLVKLEPDQHFTKPPAQYNESSLVKEMDNLGIGRPSTYSLIISTLLERKYVEKEGRNLHPTQLGVTVNDIVTRQFPEIFNVRFTAQMEEELDQIESGEKDRLHVLHHFYGPFRASVHRAMEQKEEIKESLQKETEEVCPECGKPLVIKWGRNGQFIACTGYPKCRYTRPLEVQETTAETCEECGAPMIVKTGRYGRFLACSRFPSCKHTKPFSTGIPCPNEGCQGQIIERRSSRGKIFYGCSNYPECKFATWNKPVLRTCPQCQNYYMEARINKSKGAFLSCPQCKYQMNEETTIS